MGCRRECRCVRISQSERRRFRHGGVTKQKASYFLIVFRHTFIVVNQSLFSILSITQFVRVALSPSQLQTDLPSRWSTTALGLVLPYLFLVSHISYYYSVNIDFNSKKSASVIRIALVSPRIKFMRPLSGSSIKMEPSPIVPFKNPCSNL